MQHYALRNSDGRTLVIAEAAERVDAELYGLLSVPGFHRVVPIESPDEHTARLTKSFKRLGLNDAEAAMAAEGRSEENSIPRVIVPSQVGDNRGKATPVVLREGRWTATRLLDLFRPDLSPSRGPTLHAASLDGRPEVELELDRALIHDVSRSSNTPSSGKRSSRRSTRSKKGEPSPLHISEPLREADIDRRLEELRRKYPRGGK